MLIFLSEDTNRLISIVPSIVASPSLVITTSTLPGEPNSVELSGAVKDSSYFGKRLAMKN